MAATSNGPAEGTATRKRASMSLLSSLKTGWLLKQGQFVKVTFREARNHPATTRQVTPHIPAWPDLLSRGSDVGPCSDQIA